MGSTLAQLTPQQTNELIVKEKQDEKAGGILDHIMMAIAEGLRSQDKTQPKYCSSLSLLH